MAMNFLSLSATVHDKESSVAFLHEHGILHSSRKCKNDHDMTLSLTPRQDRWRCNLTTCREDITVRHGCRDQISQGCHFMPGPMSGQQWISARNSSI
uniref:Uncharacterized protein n=1 Tax=Arion vulgaris TaxID=1028688 RepID=A0A0B7ALJ7_9EUPU